MREQNWWHRKSFVIFHHILYLPLVFSYTIFSCLSISQLLCVCLILLTFYALLYNAISHALFNHKSFYTLGSIFPILKKETEFQRQPTSFPNFFLYLWIKETVIIAFLFLFSELWIRPFWVHAKSLLFLTVILFTDLWPAKNFQDLLSHVLADFFFFLMNDFSFENSPFTFQKSYQYYQIIPSNYSGRTDLRKLFESICYLNSSLLHMKGQNLIYIISG